MLNVKIENPLYLSPSLAVGTDPSGQLVAAIRKPGKPTDKMISLITRAITLCDLEFLEDPYYLDGLWHNKLKEKELKEKGDG